MKHPDATTQVEPISFPVIVQFSHSNSTIFIFTGFIAIFPTTMFSKHNMPCLFGVGFQLFQNSIANAGEELLL